MAIAFDQNLGAAQDATGTTSTTTIALTTSAAAVTGSRVFVVVNWFGVRTLSSVSGGGLTWVVDKSQTNGSDRVAIASADAPSGLASGTVITATLSGVATGKAIGGASATGIVTGSSGYLDVTGGNNPAAGTAWTSGNITTTNANDFIIAVAMADTSNNGMSSTPTSPSIEIHDQPFNAAGEGMTSAYRIETVTGTIAIAGAWNLSATVGTTVAIASYKAAAAAAKIPIVNQAIAIY